MNCRQSYHIYIIAVDWVADSFRAEWNIYGGPNEAAMAWQVPISGDILSLWALVKQLWPNFLWLWMCANHREMWTEYRLRKSAKTENHCKPEPYQYFTRLRLNVLLLQKQKVVFWNHNSEIKKKKVHNTVQCQGLKVDLQIHCLCVSESHAMAMCVLTVSISGQRSYYYGKMFSLSTAYNTGTNGARTCWNPLWFVLLRVAMT